MVVLTWSLGTNDVRVMSVLKLTQCVFTVVTCIWIIAYSTCLLAVYVVHTTEHMKGWASGLFNLFKYLD